MVRSAAKNKSHFVSRLPTYPVSKVDVPRLFSLAEEDAAPVHGVVNRTSGHPLSDTGGLRNDEKVRREAEFVLRCQVPTHVQVALKVSCAGGTDVHDLARNPNLAALRLHVAYEATL